MKAFMLLLALVAGVLAGPIKVRHNNNDVCATTCTGSNKFKYEPGTTYVFDYKVQTETSMEGASGETSVLGISATAHIEVISKCDMALRLYDVKLSPSSDSHFERSLENAALRFSFQDGIIEDLCPVDGEADWSLNIKRGVLSTFQNSMENLERDQTVHETDVTGKCPAEYKLITNKGWYTTAVRKTKHLLGCMDRHGWRSAMQAAPYRVSSDFQSLPLMKSEHVCDQEVENRGYIKSTICKENHVFRPFSNYKNGSSTKVLQKLTFKSQVRPRNIRTAAFNKRTTMLFTHSNGKANIEFKQHQVEAKLSELCSLSKNDVRPQTPELFSELIVLMRNLDASALRNVYRQAEQGTICSDNKEKTKKFFLDAIPMVSTSSSVQLMKELLISKSTTGIEAEMWLTSLALIQSPTREMISEVKAILDIKELESKSMLPISSLVNNYCNKNAHCSEEYEVTGILSTLQRNLGYGCYVRDENLEKVLLTLRAIGNAGHSDSVAPAVSNCYTRQSNPIEVRIAALDAMRRIPCSADRSESMSILKDSDEDSELRIAAYLAIMKCPSDDVIGDVKNLLSTEEANQVSSFIWSHLTNLMETSSPHKQSISEIIKDQRLKKSFDLERIKYSRNYEGSFMFESLNTGAMAESNVIWSSKSFIPRSAMVNLTVDLFGSSINLFEVGGRIEGLEHLLETYLGPFGYFGEKKSTKKSIEKSRAQLDRLRGSMYMRMFGNEMSYSHFKGVDGFNTDKFNYLEFLIKISKNHDYSFSKSFVFLDSSIIIPTSSGLPLNLTVNGAASYDLKASGSVDLRKVATSPRSLDIDGTIKPSGAVTITGSMAVDAFVTKSGLKMTSTLHSSTALTGRIRLERGKILEVVFDMPQDKMEVLELKSRFFTLNGDKKREQALITENQKSKAFCTGGKLAKIIGLEMCGELKFPNASMVDEAPYFPFTGPVSMSLMLHKRDSHVGYKLLAKRVETKSQSIAQIAFDTPGSAVKRAIAMDFILNFPNKELEISTTSPWTEMLLKGNIVNELKQKAFTGTFIKDGLRYSVHSVVDVDYDGPITKLSPRIEIIRPNVKNVVFAGTVDIDGLKRFSTDLSLIGAIDHPISLKGAFVDTSKEQSIQGSLQIDQSGEYTILAMLEKVKNKKATFLRIIPTFLIKTPTEHIATISGKLEQRAGRQLKGELSATIKKLLLKPIEIKFNNAWKEDKKKNMKYDTDIMVASNWLTAKVDSFITVQSKTGGTTGRLSVDYKLPKIKKNKLILSGKFNNKSTKTLHKYLLNLNFIAKKNPEYNFVSNIDLSHNKRHTGASGNLRYGKNIKDKNSAIVFDSTVSRKGSIYAGSANYKVNTVIPVWDVDVSINGDHKHDKKYLQNNMEMVYGKGKNVKTNIKLYDRSSKQLKIGGEVNVVYPGQKVNFDTILSKIKNKYEHTINLKMDNKKSTLKTVYSNPSSKKHTFTSEGFVHSLKPFTVSGDINLAMKKFRTAANVVIGSDKYGMELSKTSKDLYNHDVGVKVYCPYGELSTNITSKDSKYTCKIDTQWDKTDKTKRVLLNGTVFFKSMADIDGTVKLVYPGRTLTLAAKHQNNGKIDSHVDVAWSRGERIDLDFSHSHTADYRNRNIGTILTITTPFTMLPKLVSELTYDSGNTGIKTNSRLSWGDKRDEITTSAFIKNPISITNVDIEAKASTPFSGFRQMSVDFSHDLNHQLKTKLKAEVDSKKAEMDVSIGLRGDPNQELKLDGRAGFKSNIRGMESMSVEINHMQNSPQYTTEIIADHNGKQYTYNVDMTLQATPYKYQNAGKVILRTPYYRSTSNWNHLWTATDIKSTMTSSWGRGKTFNMIFNGNYDSSALRKMNGNLILQTPWDPVRDMEFDMKHECSRGYLSHKLYLKQNSRIIGSGNVNYRRGAEQITFDINALNPYTDNLSGSVSVSTQMPYSSRVELEWARDKKITVDGSLTQKYPNHLDTSIRINTPFRNLHSVVLEASNKMELNGWKTIGNLEYNTRKSIRIETTCSLRGQTKLTVLLTTPFNVLRKFESGILVSISDYEITGQADFEMIPVTGKFSSSVTANWQSDITGKVRLETPFKEFPYAQIDVSSSMTKKGRHSQIELEYSPRQIVHLDALYNIMDPTLFDIKFSSPFTHMEELGAKLRHAMGRNGMQSHVTVVYAPYKTIDGHLKLNWNRGINGNMVVKTPFRGYEHSKSTFSHSGVWYDFHSTGEIEINNQKVDADIDFKHGKITSTSLTLHTPLNDLEELKFTLNKNGNINNLDFITKTDLNGKQLAEISLGNKMSRGLLKTDLKITNPLLPIHNVLIFSIDHYGVLPTFRTKVSSSLGPMYKINSDTNVNLRMPTIDISSDVDYLYGGEGRKVGVKVIKEGNWNNMQGRIEGVCDGQKASLSGNFMFADKIAGSLTFTTPSLGNKDVSVSFNHEGPLDKFQSDANIRYLDTNMAGKISLYQNGLSQINSAAEFTTPFQGFEQFGYNYQHGFIDGSLTGKAKLSHGYNKEIIADVAFNRQPDMSGSVSLITPFEDYKKSRIAFRTEGVLTDFKVHGEGELFGDKVEIDSEISHNDKKTGGMINVKGTSDKIQDLSVFFNKNGEYDNFEVTSKIIYAGEKIMECKVTSLRKHLRSEYTFKLDGSKMENIDASFEHTGVPFKNCVTAIKAAMDLAEVDYKSVISVNDNSIDAKIDGGYIWFQQKQRGSLSIQGDGDLSKGKMAVIGKLNNDEIKASTDYTINSNAVQIGALVNTPFTNFRDLAAKLDYVNRHWHIVNAMVRYMDGQEVSTEVKFVRNDDWKKFETFAVVQTPFKGYERSSFSYGHVLDDESLQSDIKAEYGRNEIKSDLSIESRDENKINWKIRTPFRGYRALILSAKMNKNRDIPSADVTVKLGGSSYSIQGEADTVSIPMTTRFIISTPIKGLKKFDLRGSHRGEWNDFRSTINLDSQPTGSIENDVSFVYNSPSSIDASIEFKSEFDQFEDLRFSVKNQENRGGVDSNVIIKWAPAQKIELDSSYSKTKGWATVDHVGSLTLVTPFEPLKSTIIKLSKSGSDEKITQKIFASLNDEDLVDMNIEADIGLNKEITVNMDKPRQMQLTATVQTDDKMGGEVFLNWDKTHPQKNIRLQASHRPTGRYSTDKEFNLKLIHPIRTMGLNGVLQVSDNQVKSKGALIWNEHKGHRVAYDIDLSDTSRRNKKTIDGSLKIELPTRSLAVEGVMQNTQSFKSVDGSIMWDVEADQSKKVGIKATITPNRKTNKVEVVVSLPSINKDIRLDSEITLDDGRVLFDGKTEFSYSPDSRKTLVFTSNVQDVSYDRSLKNYTISLGIRHPYTNTDVQLTSHVGRSTDKLSTGMSMEYLTASRNRMNMMLLGEIDQLKRQINIDIISPLKRVKFSGEVDSLAPFHVSMKNEINGLSGLSAELAVDNEKKTLDFQTTYNLNDLSNTFHIEGRYLNRSAIRVEAYTQKNGHKIVDSVASVRLNTSRILHTKVTWKPRALQELEVTVNEKIIGNILSTKEILAMQDAVGKEITHKYTDVTRHTAEEMAPVIGLISTELKEFEKELEILAVELRRMYNRNDLYVRDFLGFYLEMYNNLKEFIEEYKVASTQMIQNLMMQLEAIKNYPIREKYYTALYAIKLGATQQLAKFSELLSSAIRELKQTLKMQTDNFKGQMLIFKSKLANHHSVKALKAKIVELQNINYAKYVSGVTGVIGQKVGSLNLGDKYNTAIYNVHSLINNNLDAIMKRDEVKYLHSVGNEVYQQGKWAYGYWRVEDNVKKQMEELFTLMNDLLKEEYNRYKQMFTFLPKVNVTVYDPVRGELQADVYLPVVMETLDSLPTNIYYESFDDMRGLVDNYLPSKDTVVNMYNDYFPETNQTDSFESDLKDYLKTPPKRKLRNLRRRRQQRV